MVSGRSLIDKINKGDGTWFPNFEDISLTLNDFYVSNDHYSTKKLFDTLVRFDQKCNNSETIKNSIRYAHLLLKELSTILDKTSPKTENLTSITGFYLNSVTHRITPIKKIKINDKVYGKLVKNFYINLN